MEFKNLFLFNLTFFLGIIMLQLVSAQTFSTFTLSIVDLLKVFIALMGLIILVVASWAFFAGGPSFIRLIVMMFYIGMVLLIVLIFMPIVINFITTTIG